VAAEQQQRGNGRSLSRLFAPTGEVSSHQSVEGLDL